MQTTIEKTIFWWRIWALVLVLGVGAGLAAGLMSTGEPLKKSLRATAPGHAAHVHRVEVDGDSLDPMLLAYYRKVTEPESEMYAIFFDDRVKFQYPPSSVLTFDLLPRSWTITDGKPTEPLKRFWTWLCYSLFLLTVVISAVILEMRLARERMPARSVRASLRRVGPSLLLSIALGLMFYPLTRAHELGQVQILITCLIAIGLALQITGREAASAVCLGLCTLIKPQYGVILLWAVLRRRWRFGTAFAAVLAIGGAISVVRFGLADNLDYLTVLRAIGSAGEAFWANQSINGLLNRLLGNGSAIQWTPNAYPDPDPRVQVLTILSSLVVLGLALWPGRRPAGSNGGETVADLPLVLVAITIASPVAWEHHYGVFLPVFAVVLIDMARLRPLGRATAPLLGFAYVAIASVFLRPEIVFANKLYGLLGSHLFFGGIAFFILLVALRTSEQQRIAQANSANQSNPPARKCESMSLT